MSLQPIIEWRRDVCAALRSGHPSKIAFTKGGLQRWSREFPSAYRYQIEAAVQAALRARLVFGCPVELPYPPGTTWEFFFLFLRETLYGKVLLYPGSRRILILSAHRPDRPALRCE